MKKIVFSLLFFILCFPLTAQIDYLEPVKAVANYKGELGDYYRNVFALLNTDFQSNPYARFAVIPSFSPEYAMSVEKKNGRCYLVSNTLSRTYWQSEKGEVKVETNRVAVDLSLYKSLGELFSLVTSQIQDLDGFSGGMDGIVYYFFSMDANGKMMMGRKWSPEKGSLMERLVLVCQSAYLLSRSENISEETLIKEATSLLKDLQKRNKEQPDAYKKPSYAGVYTIGAQEKVFAGKKPLEVLPRFSDGSVEDYIRRYMIYPGSLLAKKANGYALCQFTIDKEGVILRPHILKSTSPEFAEESLRIVKGMPRWIPALSGNKAVECDYTLYIPFRWYIYKENLHQRNLKK